MRAFDYAQTYLNDLFLLPTWLHTPYKLLTPRGWRFHHATTILEDYTRRLVQESKKATTTKHGHRGDLLGMMMSRASSSGDDGHDDGHGQALTDQALRDMVMNVSDGLRLCCMGED